MSGCFGWGKKSKLDEKGEKLLREGRISITCTKDHQMKTILIIDDDQGFREVTVGLLEGWGWEILQAGGGEEGLEMAMRHRPSVILCDLAMSVGSGDEFCRKARGMSELSGVKIVMISGSELVMDRRRREEMGADGYLLKPLGGQELREALERLNLDGEWEGGDLKRLDVEGEEMKETRLKFWGVRGSIPTPGPSTVEYGGNTSCVELRVDGQLIVLDAGSGIRPLGQALTAEFGLEPIDITLLVTHTHWDHIQGFPFFLPAYHARNRVHILGYEGAKDGLAATLSGQMESPYFPIELKSMPGNIVIEELREMFFEVGSVRVEACVSNHPGVCVGYRVFSRSGSVVYLPDNELFTEEQAGGKASQRVEEINARLLKFVAGAEVLIIDAQYTVEEYRTHVGWGHGCLDDVVRFGVAGGVKRMYLFHHDPVHDDAFVTGMLEHARELGRLLGSGMEIEAAREGVEWVVG